MSGKEIARWNNDEVYALLHAWREGLELQPEPLRRGKLNGFVSRRFHELRAHQRPVRTACSIVYKKKYWRSMVQFICEYNLQTPNGDWYALGLAQRKAIFEQRKTTSYKFTDLDQHAAYEIAKLITLEDGTPGLADLVYGSAINVSGHGGSGDSDSDSSAWPPRRGSAPPAPASGAAADAAALSLLRHSERKRSAVQYHDASSSSDEEDDVVSEDDDTFDGDDMSEPEYHPRGTTSRSSSARTSILRPVAHERSSTYNAPEAPVPTRSQPPRPFRLGLARNPDHEKLEYEDDVDTRSSASSAESELQTVVSRLEQQTQELKALVREERDARARAQAREEQQTRERLEQTERRARLLEVLERTQRAAVDDANARREEREHWATILHQLQLDREELEREQVARNDEHARRQAVLREIEQSQLERIQMLDEWATDRSERATVLEKMKCERTVREAQRCELSEQTESAVGQTTEQETPSTESPRVAGESTMASSNGSSKGQSSLASAATPSDNAPAKATHAKTSSSHSSHSVHDERHDGSTTATATDAADPVRTSSSKRSRQAGASVTDDDASASARATRSRRS